MFDVASLIVGVIIGSGIFVLPSMVAGNAQTGEWILLAWLFGGALSFIGALCYAELATTYPHMGGDYWYLRFAYGRWAGFLLAWSKLWVIETGAIAVLANVFGIYATQLYAFPYSTAVYAAGAAIGCTIINCLGVTLSKTAQNLLTSAKVLGLIGVFLVALLVENPTPATPVEGLGSFRMALIFVLFAYGGWNECANIAAEVRDLKRNILRSLLLGLSVVTGVYLLLNASFLHALGPGGLAKSEAVAADVMSLWLGPTGARVVSALIVISTLGAVNGYIFTGARIYYALGTDHALFSLLGRWNPRFDVPINALLAECVIVCLLIFSGRFEDLVMYTTPAFWLFFTLTGISLFVLRYKDPDRERPYRVHFYPITPLLFIATCAMMFHSGLAYAGRYAFAGFLIVLAGLPFYFLSEWMGRKTTAVKSEE